VRASKNERPIFKLRIERMLPATNHSASRAEEYGRRGTKIRHRVAGRKKAGPNVIRAGQNKVVRSIAFSGEVDFRFTVENASN
jgi:hypothetical protein